MLLSKSWSHVVYSRINQQTYTGYFYTQPYSVSFSIGLNAICYLALQSVNTSTIPNPPVIRAPNIEKIFLLFITFTMKQFALKSQSIPVVISKSAAVVLLLLVVGIIMKIVDAQSSYSLLIDPMKFLLSLTFLYRLQD